jgi:four helix bundle protein
MKDGGDGERRYDLEDRLLEYAARMMKLCESLPSTMSGRHVSGQLLRSGTAPLSHHGEAQAAESPEDFRHKMKLALKELKESWRWLRLIERAELIGKSDRLNPLLKETDELIRIFATSIKTSQSNSARSRGTKKP